MGSEDSECSNNDKHGASEVIISALMPKSNDSTTSDEVQLFSDHDVDQLLDNIQDIFDTLSHKESDIELAIQIEQKQKMYSSSTSNGALSSNASYSGPDEPILE